MAGNGSHHIHNAKRLKLEPWSNASLGQPAHPDLHNINYTSSGYPPDGISATQYMSSGGVTQASQDSPSHMLPSQGMSGSYPAPSAMAPGSSAAGTQHRGSIDDRHQQHVPGRQSLSVSSPLHQGRHQHGSMQTPGNATHLMSPASGSGPSNLVNMGSQAVTPVGGPPMGMPQRTGSIHHSPLTQDTAASGMLGHFQLGMGQGQMGGPNTTPSPVLNTNMGLSIPMYQQQGQPGQIMTTYPPRRKAIRAAQACDACRARKAKCDEGRPSCGFCKESGVPCVYREVPPPKQDRTLLQILDRLGRIEGLLSSQGGSSAPDSSSATGPTLSGNATASEALPPTHQGSPGVSIANNEAGNIQLGQAVNDPPTEDDDDLNFPYQHTTAAHKLLSWPSIRELVQDDCGEWGEGFVHAVEESRGNLQIWGKGESRNGIAYADPNAWFDEGESDGYAAFFRNWQGSSIPEDVSADTAIWDGDDSFVSGLGEILQHPGGLAADRVNLNLQPDVMHELLQSYLRNIHILHPILNKDTITHMVRLFAEKTSYGVQSSPSSMPRQSLPTQRMSVSGDSAQPIGGRTASPATGKRKRATSISGPSPGPSTFPYPPNRSSSVSPQRIPRTIHSAVVLLVLALGAICLHRKPVPGPVPTNRQRGSTIGDPLSPFSNQNSGFGQDADSPFHDSPGGDGPPVMKDIRNIDVIPGLAYFAKASELIGYHAGANELENVQAGLLAGLYWGQLGRVLDSWKWISWACMGCQVLVRLKLRQETNPLRKELIQRAFWSCQQLESDVLAELDLPPSGISRLEDEVSFPGGDRVAGNETGQDESVFMYYLAQIALRKLLNRAHSELYKQRDHPTPINRSLSLARELDYQLERWKATLPEPLRWGEMDPPSSDINAARLRAKYFGARYIIHRPFVFLRMHGNGAASSGLPATSPSLSGLGSQTDSPTVQPGGLSRKPSAVGVPVAVEEPSDRSHPLDESCKKCLDAAVQSTKAFHAFSTRENRPIITNVFGTAHAQFGNLLVLQAAYNSPQLSHLVDGLILEDLFTKTMEWLRTLSPISPSLNRDWIILRGVWSRNSSKFQNTLS